MGGYINMKLILTLFICFLICVTADYITGVMKAYVNSEVSSKVGRKGILKKASYIAVVFSAMMVDYLIFITSGKFGVNYDPISCVLVMAWFVINELISILENVSSMGAPCPKFLKSLMKRLQNNIESVDKGDKPK